MSTELSHPKQELLDQAVELAKRASSTATKRAYASDFRIFCDWCADNGFESLPASPDTVALYITHQYKVLGRAASTIRRSMTSIRQAHKLSGHPVPITEVVRQVERGIRREAGTLPTQATPLTLRRLERVIGAIPGDFIGLRDRALILFGWSGAFRRSEIVGFSVSDIEYVDEGIICRLRRSKTDQAGEGRAVPIPYVDDKRLCAVRALRRWLVIAGIESGPLFRAVGPAALMRMMWFASERGLTAQSVSLIVKRRVSDAGYDPKTFSGHSLRAGFATSAASAGVAGRDIRKITGHASDHQFSTYIREGTHFINHPLSVLLGSSSKEVDTSDQYSKSSSSQESSV